MSATISLILLLNSQVLGLTGTQHVARTGVPDSFLVSLGTAAVSFLYTRLLDPATLANHPDIVQRIDELTTGVPNFSNDLLKKFIRKATEDKRKLPPAEFLAVNRALVAIGHRCTRQDVEYLRDWVTGKRKSLATVSGIENSAVSLQLRKSAALGLAWPGSTYKASLQDFKNLLGASAQDRQVRRFIDEILDQRTN